MIVLNSITVDGEPIDPSHIPYRSRNCITQSFQRQNDSQRLYGKLCVWIRMHQLHNREDIKLTMSYLL